MANIFKTTLKKDIIADIANNNVREIRFPITKFWATRFADEFDLDKKEFTFKNFDSLELSSPSNKDSGAMTYVFDFERIYVDGDEFVVVFKMSDEDIVDSCPKETEVEVENVATEVLTELHETPIVENDVDGSDVEFGDDEYETPETAEIPDITNTDVFTLIKDWFDDERVLENFYEDENVFATNARQIIILPKGRVLGFKKTLPVNNDVEIRVEFDMNKRIYFDSILDFDIFEEEVLRMLSEVKKNNFVFVWGRNTGIFMDNNDRVYFGIKYSTRKSIGFNRRYNVQ